MIGSKNKMIKSMKANTLCEETHRLIKIQNLLKEQRQLEYRIQEINEEHLGLVLKLNEINEELDRCKKSAR